ncbi:hypothetical protein GCM10023093_19880 [Nemorincola caseinilytica]|uniref:Activator of Hsp90 ATPase homologue 1/2-like C-terminal domain-containing protein n=1 Tax=Nemorincola caseinilytica TaxID=2054315 RepID=A0ABP8NIY6_9BACT
MNTTPFVIERTLNSPIDTVWEAITDAEKMKHWYFDLPGFRAEVGYEFSFTGGTEEHQYLHLCRITEVVPGHKIAYTWRYDGYPGESLVTFELSEEGNGTRIKLTHSGLETFGTTNPDLARHNFEAGWTDIIGRSLPTYLGQQ